MLKAMYIHVTGSAVKVLCLHVSHVAFTKAISEFKFNFSYIVGIFLVKKWNNKMPSEPDLIALITYVVL